MNDLERILYEVNKEQTIVNRIKDRIIICLVIIVLIQSIVIGAFVYYESTFETTETVTTTETSTKDIDISSDGDGASASYNEVGGNQYNDNATHNDGKGGDE